MALDIMDDQKVLVSRGGDTVYEGLWADRPEDYAGDWYRLADVEEDDILLIAR